MLIIFDLDQTLVRPVPGVKVPNRIDQQEMIPGVVERCAELRAEGHRLAMASNQGGVALGIADFHETLDRVEDAAKKIGTGGYWIASLYHEKGTIRQPHNPDEGYCNDPFWRKPMPGMLLHLMLETRTTAPDTLFVGDQESDRQAAINAGVRFEWAKDFFGWT